MRSRKVHQEEEVYEEDELGSKKEGPSFSNPAAVDRADSKDSDRANAMRSKHSVTEQRRRSKINERFQKLRDLIPNVDQKRDTASFLSEVIEYVQYLQEKVQKYEGPNTGWSAEPTKLMPWRNSHWRAKNLVNHPEAIKNGSGSGSPFPGNFEEENVTIAPAMLTSAHNAVQSDPSGYIECNSMDQQAELASKVLPMGMPLQENMAVSVRNDCLPFQRSVSDAQSIECPAISAEPEEPKIEGGTISISTVYSHRLLNSLAQALETTDIDLSHANIFVQIDLGKRANHGLISEAANIVKEQENMFSGNQTMTPLRDPSHVEDTDRTQKRFRT